MDLRPFYELRERLKTGAVAGAGLAPEDFRLTRAAEAMAPLEAASPVFAKLGALVRNLLSPECADRAGALLDAVTLADAILCTQGAVAAEGPVEPLTPIGAGKVVTNVPYSLLSPLLEALTSSGSGKYSFVLNTHREQPELFKDYRVQEAMIKALGASYGELADQVEQWLSMEDENLLPLLKLGFDPKGKKDMVRRLRVIEAIAGPEAEEFYQSQLAGSEREVRQELIHALGRSEGNADQLIDLCRTEKGNAKKAAHWALSRMESPAAWDYWNKMAEKKPEQAAEYMALSKSKGASKLTARLIGQWLEPFEADAGAPLTQASADYLGTLFTALPGKRGPEICDIYRRMAALGTALDRPVEEPEEGRPSRQSVRQPLGQSLGQSSRQSFQQPAQFSCGYSTYGRGKTCAFSQAVPMILKQALVVNPDPELLALARELGNGGEGRNEAFAAAALSALLITETAERAFLAAESYMNRSGIFKKTVKKEDLAVLTETLDAICWDRNSGSQAYRILWTDPADGSSRYMVCPLRQPMDRRWYERLMAMGASQDVDTLLAAMIRPGDQEICGMLGEYFYKKALTVSGSQVYMEPLCRCGWTRCEGLAVRYCRSRGKISAWDLSSFIQDMPGDNQAKAQEAEQVVALIEKGEIKYTSGNPAFLRQIILNLRRPEVIGL